MHINLTDEMNPPPQKKKNTWMKARVRKRTRAHKRATETNLVFVAISLRWWLLLSCSDETAAWFLLRLESELNHERSLFAKREEKNLNRFWRFLFVKNLCAKIFLWCRYHWGSVFYFYFLFFLLLISILIELYQILTFINIKVIFTPLTLGLLIELWSYFNPY